MRFSDKFKDKLKKAKKVVVLTGAGISAESGISTFRDKNGIWTQVSLEDVATPQGFKKNPEYVWKFYDQRRIQIKDKSPNPGHICLAKMENLFKSFWIATQNIDELHQKAGSKNVIELHGNIWELICTGCGKIIKSYDTPLKEIPPYCECGAMYRPNVVWFGEPLSESAIEESFKLFSEAELCFTIGTSSLVQPAASFPIICKRQGGFLVEINPSETSISYLADEIFREKSGEILPKILNVLI